MYPKRSNVNRTSIDRSRIAVSSVLAACVGLVLAGPGTAIALGAADRKDAPIARPVATAAVAPQPTTAVRAQQAGPFNNGVAKAQAQVSRTAPGVGGLALGIDSGLVLTDYVNTLARANAHGMNFGLVGTVLESPGACGPEPEEGAPPPEEEQADYRAPRPLVIDSNDPAEERVVDATVDGPNQDGPARFNGPQVGRQYVRAVPGPFSQAISTVDPIRIPPEQSGLPAIIEIGGGEAESITRVVDGNTREAFARVDASVKFLDGAIALDGMHWETTHRTGANPIKEASFSISSSTTGEDAGPLSALGDLPVDGAQITEDALNALLLPFGISTRFPKVELQTEPSDLVRITPMVIELVNSPATAAALGPLLSLTREQKEQLFTELVAAEVDCALDGYKASGLLVVDIVASVAAGTGFMEIEIGGAQAATEAVEFINPFANFAPTPPPIPAPPIDIPASRGTATPPAVSILGSGSTSGSQTSGATAANSSSGGDQAVSGQPISTVGGEAIDTLCRSVHDVTGLSCSSGAAALVGILGLIATIGTAALDWRYQQRGVRSIPGDDWAKHAATSSGSRPSEA